MSLDHKNKIGIIESSAPSVRTAEGMIIIYDNPEPSEIGSEFYFHGHTLVPLTPGFYLEEQSQNQSVLKDLEFVWHLIDGSSSNNKFRKYYGGNLTELHSVFSQLQQIVEDLIQSFEPKHTDLEKLRLFSARLSEYIDRNKQEALITYQRNRTEEQKLVITNLQKIIPIVSILEKLISKYSSYLLNRNKHNENLLKSSLDSFRNAIEEVISDFSLYEKLVTTGFDPLIQKETVSLIEAEDTMAIIVQSISPALELVKNELEKKIKQMQRLKLSMEAQKQDVTAQNKEIKEAENKLKGVAPLFGNLEINEIREKIKQQQIALGKEQNHRTKNELQLELSALNARLVNKLIDYYPTLYNESADEIDSESVKPKSKLYTLLRNLENQIQELSRSKGKKQKELQKEVSQHRSLLGLPDVYSSTGTLANIRYEEAFIPVEVSPGQNLYLRTWTSGIEKICLKEKLPKQIITANCMLSGSLEGVTASKDRFQLIDHNLDVCLTDVSGSKIIDVIHDPNLSPYEISMFIQFEHELQWINNLYGDQPKPVVRYHLPGADYMLSGLRYALSGDITLPELAKYCKAVKERMEAHQHVIKEISANAGVPVIIESPLDNLDDMYRFMSRNIGSVVFPPLDVSDTVPPEEKFVNIILQTLRDNNSGSVHQRAWAAVLPENIVAARQDPIWSEKLPKTIKELLYLANSMEFAFASIDCNTEARSADAPFKEDFNVLALHSTDESPIAKNCIDPKFNLVEKFGHFMAVFVQPRELYDGGAKSNNPFRMDLATAKAVREQFLAEVIRKRNPSEVLQSIIRADIHRLKETFQPESAPAESSTLPAQKATNCTINPGVSGSALFGTIPKGTDTSATSFQPSGTVVLVK